MSVGLVIFAYYTSNLSEKKNMVFLLLSGAMIFAGSLVRRDSILAFIPFVIILIIATVLQCKSRGTKVIKAGIPWLMLILFIITAWLVDAMAYKINDEWRAYKEFNRVRTNLDDYGMLDYETHQETYEEVKFGINI